MAINQSGFYGSPFLEPYLLLMLLLSIGYCSFVCARSWRVMPTGLSVKALLLIIKKKMKSFLLAFVLCTNCVSLLYALLVYPYTTIMHAIFLWSNAILLILGILILSIAWLRSRHQQRKLNRNAALMPAPLQQQKRS